MTCANVGITLMSLIIAVVALWPGTVVGWARWVIVIAALISIVIVWAGCKCKWCETSAKKASKKK